MKMEWGMTRKEGEEEQQEEKEEVETERCGSGQ